MGKKKPTPEQYLKWFGSQMPAPRANIKADPYKEFLRKKPRPPPLKHHDFQSWPTKKKAATMKKILKKQFPDQKFSVRSSKGGWSRSVNIDWTDGPSVKSVEKLQFWRYNYQVRDGRGGTESSDYIFLNRGYSPELKKKEAKRILSKHADVDNMMSYRKEEIVYREMYKTDYGSPNVTKAKTIRK